MPKFTLIVVSDELGVELLWIQNLGWLLLMLLLEQIFLRLFNSSIWCCRCLLPSQLFAEWLSSSLLDLLLGALLMLGSHMEHSCSLRAKVLITVEALVLLLDLIGHPSVLSLATTSWLLNVCLRCLVLIARGSTALRVDT